MIQTPYMDLGIRTLKQPTQKLLIFICKEVQWVTSHLPYFEGERKSLRDLAQNDAKLWVFNGEIGGYGLTLADIALGDTVILRVWNDTRWIHAMHLHGQYFWVNSIALC